MNNVVLGGSADILELSVNEVDFVSGGEDGKVVAAGVSIMAGSLTLAACPPAAGAVATIGLFVVVLGVVFD